MPCAQPSSADSIWPVWLLSSSIACLPTMIRPGCSASATPLMILATAKRFDRIVGLDQDRPVGTHGQRRAQRFFRLGRTDGDDDHFLGLAGFLQAQGLLDRNLVERVHRHLHIGKLDTGAIRLDPDLHVVVDDPLDGDEDFHFLSPASTNGTKREQNHVLLYR